MNSEQFNQNKSLSEPSNYKDDSRETKEKLLSVHRYTLGGQSIVMCGVSHIEKTGELLRYELETEIKASSIILLEAAPTIENWTSEENIALFREFLKQNGRDLESEKIKQIIDSQPGVKFFKEVEKIAFKHNKLVAVADPNTHGSAAEKFHDLDNQLTVLKMLAVVGGIAFPIVAEVTGRFKKQNKEKNKIRNESSLFSRRDFLKLGSLAVAGFGFGSLKASGLQYSMGRDDTEDAVKNMLEPLLYDFMDYRNAVVGKALNTLSKDSVDKNPITLIYGSLHYKPIRDYAENPNKISRSLKFYQPTFGSIEEKKLKVYKPNEKNWEQVRSEVI